MLNVHLRFAAFTPIVFTLVSLSLANERAIYVSPAGNDAWSGTAAEVDAQRTDGPAATLARARDLARAALAKDRSVEAGSVHIYVRGGNYFLPEPLMLSPDDSGKRGAPVVWSAYQKERPVVSGGSLVTGWTQTNFSRALAWTAKLPADAPAMVRELWFDGKRYMRCRTPKRDTYAVAARSGDQHGNEWTKGVVEFRFADGNLKAWPTATDGEAVVMTRWAESRLPIASVDEKHRIVHFAKHSVFQIDPDDRYWIENIRETLTQPGEFYVDPRGRTVTLIAPAGVDPNSAQVIVPRLANVLVLAGDPAAGRYVEHVTFQGIDFSHAQWSFDSPLAGQKPPGDPKPAPWNPRPDPAQSGFSQAAVGVPGAVWGSGVRFFTFDGCRFEHLGTYGIELGQGCQNNRITHCSLADLGAGGVKIGETGIRAAPVEASYGNEVSDCTIADGGNIFPSCVALWIGQSSGNVIARNEIHGFWYTAISVGWTWGYGPAAAQRNTIERNHIHHIGIKEDGGSPILSDMGGIYTLGNQEGGLIRLNRFHDIAALKYGGWGIYFDEGTTHLTAENNLVYRTTHGGFHQHYGKENTVRNNIFAYGRDAQIQRSRVEDHKSFRFLNNIVLWDRGNLLAGDWNKLNVEFDGNTYWHTPTSDIRFGDKTWEQWRKAGMDAHSKIADPHFANPAAGDFSFTSQSGGALAGFVPFELPK
jgi:hypothetical protein